MFSSESLFLVFFLYLAFLFVSALFIERKKTIGQKLVNNPLSYALSFTVLFTAWSFYGNVGKAATGNIYFLAFQVGAALSPILWWILLRRVVLLKQQYRITSIADFLSLRYGRSHRIAGVVTIAAMLIVIPYIVLQLKAIFTSFDATIIPGSLPLNINYSRNFIIVLMIIVFTIIIGVRRLDPTEQHKGMIMALVIESVVKLTAFLALGVFAYFFLLGGFDTYASILASLPDTIQTAHKPVMIDSYFTWFVYMLLAANAILFLPRQFHVSVVENADDSHIRTAMWIIPLYVIALNLFVFPIAWGGLVSGLPLEKADSFVLLIPQVGGSKFLTLLIFIGGCSAGIGMIMISSMTLATMVTNHLVLPLLEWTPSLGFLRRYLLQYRWITVSLVIFAAFLLESVIGDFFMLINIGVISFVAALQYTPAAIGGLFWENGNKRGAMLGMSSGIVTWLYTLVLPAFIKSGVFSPDILTSGPFGVEFLRPEALFGLNGLDPVSHAVFWTMLFNIGLYVFGSLFYTGNREMTQNAYNIVHLVHEEFTPHEEIHLEKEIKLSEKIPLISDVLNRYLSEKRSERIIIDTCRELRIHESESISVVMLSEFINRVERMLAGSIGTAVAHRALCAAPIFSRKESDAISRIYSEMLSMLRVPPEEIRQRINFYRERQVLIQQHAEELEMTLHQRENEIRERRQAEQALAEEKERLFTTLNNIDDGVITTDNHGNIILMNMVAQDITGWTIDQAAGLDVDRVFTVEEPDISYTDASPVKRALQLHSTLESTENTFLIHGDETRKLIEYSIAPIGEQLATTGTVVAFRDITEKVMMERELMKARNIESLGILAGGIAHDFNNILTAIIGNIELARLTMDESSRSYSLLGDAEKAVLRAKDLTRQLLTFARGGAPIKKTTTIDNLLQETVQFTLSGSNIKPRVHITGNLSHVDVDEGQISQVISNIIINAADSMPDGGYIDIVAENIPVADIEGVIPGGQYVRIAITDQGYGIQPDDVQKVFDPYFSRKKHGSGLGLTTSYSIIKKHGGHIIVDSTPGSGSTFYIYLPASSNRAKPAEIVTNTSDKFKGGSILVMDDEQNILDIMKEYLELLGFSVTTARSGEETIDIFKNSLEKGDPFDLVILDLTIPAGMGGKECLEHLQGMQPDVKAVVTSGYSENPVMADFTGYGFIGALPKPVDFKSLKEMIGDLV